MSFRKLVRNLMTRSFRTPKSNPVRRHFAPLGRAIEALEDRTVPAVTVSFAAGVATFTSNAASDTLQIQATATPSDILYNSGGIGLTSLTGVTQLIYNGNGGNDILIFQSPPGTHFAPTSGIQFNAGGQAGDELDMIGGASTWTSTYNPTGVQAGALSFTNTPGVLTQNILFTGTPTIRNSMTAASLAVTTPSASSDTINVFTGPNLGDIGAVQQGPVVIDGGDRDDHGFFSGGNQNGWKFIEQSLNFLRTNAFNAGAVANSVLAIGVTGSQAQAAVASAASVLGMTVTYVTGPAITSANFANFRVLYVPAETPQTLGGISNSDLALLNARVNDVRDFINSGGGIFAMTEETLTNPYGWLQIPNPFTITSANNNTMIQTPALAAAGFMITNAELTNGTPVHNAFTGPAGFNNLQVFVNNGTGQVITLGLGAIMNPGLGGAGPSTAITFGVNPSVSPQYPQMYVSATPVLSLDGAGQSDTYNIGVGTPVLSNIAIADSGASAGDAAFLFGTVAGDVFNVNSAAAKTVRWGTGIPVLETITYTAALEALTIHGPPTADVVPTAPLVVDAADSFIVTPDAQTAITVNGGNPTNGAGDTLILSVIGATFPVISPNPARPDGQFTSGNRQPVIWTSIESLPVPLGLGGTFDFQAPGSSTQAGFIPVVPTDTPTSGTYAFANVGWLSAGAGAFDRFAQFNTAGNPNSPQLVNLLRDGEWGYAGGSTNNGVFQVTVAPNQNVAVTAFIGDTYAPRDKMNVYVGVPGNPLAAKLNPSITSFDTTGGTHQFVSYDGMFNPGASSTILITIETTFGGTSAFWTIEGLDVRPQGLIAPLALTRTASSDGTSTAAPTLPGDGYSKDSYAGTGAAPFAELTVSPQFGTPLNGAGLPTDADPSVKGFQVVADINGAFTFQILRPTGTGPSLVSVRDVTGDSGTGNLDPTTGTGIAAAPNPFALPSQFSQTYSLPAVRRLDFGPSASVLATGTPQYIAFGTSAYTSTVVDALGWIGATPTGFDRGASFNALQRDGVFGNTFSDFEVDMPLNNTPYSFTALLGDPSFNQVGMYVQVVNTAGTVVLSTPATGVNTPAGQSRSVTFTATSDGSGKVRLRFGTDTTGSNAFWTLQDLEARPIVGALVAGAQLALTVNGATYTGPGAATIPGSVNADGTTSTLYSISGATPNALLTITTTLGTIGSADVGGTYTGLQVLANGAGVASFTITPPFSTTALAGTIAITETTGASLGVFTQNYAGVPPPASPPAAVAQRFDFNSGSSPTVGIAGFTGVLPSALYTTTTGYGWKTAVNGYDRGIGTGGSPTALFQDGAWGQDPGVFQVGVTAGAARDVRVYYGDPYNAWTGITVKVEGNPTPVVVDANVDRYGYVTSNGNDANSDGILDITIMGGVWVASGLDLATPGNLPTPATPAATTLPAGGARLDFNGGANDTISGFTGVPATQTYTPAVGYGWIGGVNNFERASSPLPVGLTAPQYQLYRDGAYAIGTNTFAFAVPSGAPNTYSARAYVGDSYNNWSGITLQIEGNPTIVSTNTTANPFWSYLLTGGSDVNGDGIVTITVSGGSLWVVNGFDLIRSPGVLPASAGPAGSP